MSYQLLAFENPLLDIQCNAKPELLEKYGLEANSALLAEEKHKPLYKEIVDNYNVVYVAGGAAQNTARGAQYLLPPNSTVYLGCVGEDEYAEQMKKAALADGLRTEYQFVKDTPTGTCAVLITGHHRSLVANLAAAEKFSFEKLQEAENWKWVENAKYYYMGSFFVSHEGGFASAKAISKHAADNNKVFALNLSAAWVSFGFKDRLDAILPNTDILFGNEDEARAYAKVSGWNTEDVAEIVVKLAALPKTNAARPRAVIITQGAEETVLGYNGVAKSFPVDKLAADQIVDTNGAGDGFCGGFLGLYAQGVEDLEKCIKAGHYLAKIVVTRVGPTYPPVAEREPLPAF